MKHTCTFRTKQVAESFTFPFAVPLSKQYQPQKIISLELLNQKVKTTTWLKTKFDDTQKNLLTIEIQDWNVWFNIYANGKIRIWHNNNHEAIHYFMDFIYHEFVQDSLVEAV